MKLFLNLQLSDIPTPPPLRNDHPICYTSASALQEIQRIIHLPPEKHTQAARIRLITQVIGSTVTGHVILKQPDRSSSF